MDMILDFSKFLICNLHYIYDDELTMYKMLETQQIFLFCILSFSTKENN